MSRSRLLTTRLQAGTLRIETTVSRGSPTVKRVSYSHCPSYRPTALSFGIQIIAGCRTSGVKRAPQKPVDRSFPLSLARLDRYASRSPRRSTPDIDQRRVLRFPRHPLCLPSSRLIILRFLDFPVLFFCFRYYSLPACLHPAQLPPPSPRYHHTTTTTTTTTAVYHRV